MADAFSVIENVASKIPSGQFSFLSIQTAPWWPVVWFWVKLFAWMAIATFGIIIYYKFYMQYKVRVGVKIKVGKNILDVKTDKAKIVEDKQGKRKMVLWGLRKGKVAYTCPVPESKYRMKKGKQDYYELILDDNDYLHPIEVGFIEKVQAKFDKKIDDLVKVKELYNQKIVDTGKHLEPLKWVPPTKEEEAFMKPAPQLMDAWYFYEKEERQKRLKEVSKLQEYLPMIIYSILGVTIILVTYFMFQSIGNGMSALAGQFAQIARSCTGLG